MTNPEELHRKFERPSARFWLTLAVLVLALGVTASLLARPAWRAFKSWRADHFLAQAERLLEERNVALAFERARAALQLVPTRPDAVRLNARFLAMIQSETSLSLWQRLLDSGQATLDDRASYVETALAFERGDLVADIVKVIASRQPPQDRDCRLAALYELQAGRLSEATRLARDAHRIAPFNPTNTMLLADLLIATSASPADTSPEPASAIDLCWNVAHTNGPLRIEALRRLLNPNLGGRRDREQVLELLAALPTRGPAEEVLLAETQIQLDPAGASHVVSNLVARLPRDDVEYLTLVVDALVRQGRYQDVLKLTTAGRSFQNHRLFLDRYAALIGLGQVEEAYRHLLAEGAPVPPFELELARVRTALRIGDPKRRDAHLKELLTLAGGNPSRIRAVAELADACDSTPLAADAWKKLSSRPADAPNALRRLVRVADRRGDTWTARDYARRALRIGPADDDLRLQIAYYDLLLGEDLDRAFAEAERQRAQRPDVFFVRAVAALAHLRLGTPEQARAILDRFVVDDSAMRNDALAVVAATYGANGLDARARDLAGRIPLTSLRPEERELIRPWLLPTPLGAGLRAPLIP